LCSVGREESIPCVETGATVPLVRAIEIIVNTDTIPIVTVSIVMDIEVVTIIHCHYQILIVSMVQIQMAVRYEYGELNQSKLMSYCGLNNVKHKEILDDMVKKGLLIKIEEA
jgi:hypothetical protein